MSHSGDPSSNAAAAEPTPESVLGHEEFAERLRAMLAGARQDVVIFSYDLDRRIYGDAGVVAALRSFLLEHRRGRVRGIVNSPRLAMRGAHRLVELSRVLSSRIEFRALPGERCEAVEDYVIVDQRVLLLRSDPQELEARYYASAPALARQQLRGFDDLWQESPPAREFTQLGL